MTNTTQRLGRRGEELAARFLERLGWRILERNWRSPQGEADIIALDPECDALVVIEVKTRSGEGYGSPLEAITYRKVRTLRQLAASYARQRRSPARLLRVDAIGILWPQGAAPQVSHARGIEER